MRITKIARDWYTVRLGGRRVAVRRLTPSVWSISSAITDEVRAKRIGLKAAIKCARSVLRRQRREENLIAARRRPAMPSLI